MTEIDILERVQKLEANLSEALAMLENLGAEPYACGSPLAKWARDRKQEREMAQAAREQ